jgi:hypothetical protein
MTEKKVVVITKGEAVSESSKPIEKAPEAKAIDFSMFEDMAEVGEDREGGLSRDMHTIGSEVAQFGKALNSVSHRQAKRPKDIGIKQTEHDLESVGSIMKSFLFG